MSLSKSNRELNSFIDIEQSQSIEEFTESLGMAKWWSSQNLHEDHSPHEVFRTYNLRPEPLAGSRKRVVESVIRQRRHRLPNYSQEIGQLETNNSIGRLLVYEPDNNLADGAARNETHGFFDDDNVPPWDLWIAYIHEITGENYLIAWIPDRYVQLAESGISVNPERCIYWLDESRNLLAKFFVEKNSE